VPYADRIRTFFEKYPGANIEAAVSSFFHISARIYFVLGFDFNMAN